ncbi:MFS transporter [Cohnella sp. CFH 77786]|uniref:MFS transporter n=1 Tax=Cohnella sp. CFH 77786 TaxID=2662265 RepID=UPI001C60F838|nr:MFS transporter [Cohnella sp. CFH 77786]MBW5446988.1 MFS transporter [Cohnella sp. CFH 77786]
MKEWLADIRRVMEPRRNESSNRKSLRIMLLEGIPANILGNLLGGPLQTAFLLYLGFTSAQIGIVLAIPPFTLLIQIFVAFAMRRMRNRRLFLLLFAVLHRVLWAATGLIPLLSPQAAWVPLYILLFLLSFASAQIGGIIWTSLMADAVPPAVRGKYFGIRNTIHFAVVCLTLLAGGQILEWWPGSAGFAALYVISAACIVWNGWELARYPNPPFEPSGNGSSASLLLRPFADKAFLSATAFIALFLLAQNIAVPLYSYAMLNVLKLDYATVTLITMLQNVVMMVGYYYWGVLNGRYPARKLLLWTFPLIAGSCFLWLGMAVLPALPVLIAVHVLLGVGLGGYNLLVFNFLIGDTPKSERPMYVAIFSALTGFAGFLGPLAGGWMYKAAAAGPEWLQRFGLTAMTGAVLMAFALGVGPLVFGAGRNRKPPFGLGA